MRRTSTIATLFCTLVTSVISAQTQIYKAVGSLQADGFGHAVRTIADVNGDGAPDFMVGAPSDNALGYATGSAWAFSGMSGTAIYQWVGANAGESLGAQLDGVGDLNGDGIPDVVLGGSGYEQAGSRVGRVALVSGGNGQLIHQWTGSADTFFGWVAASTGDIDGDGVADVLATAPSVVGPNGEMGSAVALSGATFAPLFTFSGTAQNRVGLAGCGPGDVNGDGFTDIILRFDTASSAVARVYSGSNGALLYHLIVPGATSYFANAMRGVGDVNHDGRADIVVTDTHASTGSGFQSGALHLFSGATGHLLKTLSTVGNRLGSSLGAAGDIDGDSYPDIVAGAQEYDRAYVFSGNDGSLLRTMQGSFGERFGASVDGAGDLDGDGFDDVLVGASIAFSSGTGPNYVAAFSGCDASVNLYGASCVGSGGFAPALFVTGCPNAGSSITVSLESALGGAQALLVVGTQSASLPVLPGCSLLVAPTLLTLAWPTPIGGAGPGTGSASFGVTLPSGVTGVTIAIQSFVIDPLASGGFSATNGVELVVP